MEERISYSEMRSWLLDCYYQYCRGKFMSHEEWAQGEYEIGYAYDQYCDTFSTAIEKLMLEVLAIILAGGRLPQFEQYHRQKISDLLEKNDLKNLLANVPIEEGEEFVHDMKILRLI